MPLWTYRPGRSALNDLAQHKIIQPRSARSSTSLAAVEDEPEPGPVVIMVTPQLAAAWWAGLPPSAALNFSPGRAAQIAR